MFTPRTTPLIYGEEPWKWDVDSVWQCTWYSFWRFYQVHGIFPTYQNRATKIGSYNNANTWLVNYRDPVKPMGKDYIPVAGDIVVYDWSDLGHVAFMETDTMTSSYGNGKADSFTFQDYRKFNGEILGFLHSDLYPILPVERNTNVDQIETTDDTLRIRNKPSLEGEIIGHVKIGFYNVLNMIKTDYTWYEIAPERWCADITTKYLPKNENDFIEQIRKWSEAMISKSKSDEEKIRSAEEDFKKIREVTTRWTTQ